MSPKKGQLNALLPLHRNASVTGEGTEERLKNGYNTNLQAVPEPQVAPERLGPECVARVALDIEAASVK